MTTAMMMMMSAIDGSDDDVEGARARRFVLCLGGTVPPQPNRAAARAIAARAGFRLPTSRQRLARSPLRMAVRLPALHQPASPAPAPAPSPTPLSVVRIIVIAAIVRPVPAAVGSWTSSPSAIAVTDATAQRRDRRCPVGAAARSTARRVAIHASRPRIHRPPIATRASLHAGRGPRPRPPRTAARRRHGAARERVPLMLRRHRRSARSRPLRWAGCWLRPDHRCRCRGSMSSSPPMSSGAPAYVLARSRARASGRPVSFASPAHRQAARHARCAERSIARPSPAWPAGRADDGRRRPGLRRPDRRHLRPRHNRARRAPIAMAAAAPQPAPQPPAAPTAPASSSSQQQQQPAAALVANESLLAVGIIEKDQNGDVLWTWCYPAADQRTREALLAKCGLRADAVQLEFVWGRDREAWFYALNVAATEASLEHLPRVRAPCARAPPRRRPAPPTPACGAIGSRQRAGDAGVDGVALTGVQSREVRGPLPPPRCRLLGIRQCGRRPARLSECADDEELRRRAGRLCRG